MKIIIIIGLIFFSPVSFALELDVKALQEKSLADPSNVEARLILTRYFLQNNDLGQARFYLDEALALNPPKSLVSKIQQELAALESLSIHLKDSTDLNKVALQLYDEQKYRNLIRFYNDLKVIHANKVPLNDSSLLNISRVLMWEGRYNDSLRVLKKVTDKRSLSYFEIKAENCFNLDNLSCAKKYYSSLFQATNRSQYGKRLIEIYLREGNAKQARKIMFSLQRSNDQRTLAKHQEKILELEEAGMKKLRAQYADNPTYENMKALAFTLYDSSPSSATELVKKHVNKYPDDQQAKVFLARLYTWQGKENQKALDLLRALPGDDLEAKLLMGKIFAWEKKFEQSSKLLNQVYAKGSSQQRFEAKKMLAFVSFWKEDEQQAKKLFKELQKEQPNDKEINEALFLLEGNVKPLISRLERQYINDKSSELVLQLAELHLSVKNYKRSAYFYEQYLAENPHQIHIYKSLGDIYLKMGHHFRGFGLLEFYANYLNTPESFYQLAQRYFWEGFNNEALEVLDDLIEKHPDYRDARILKANITKVHPKFVKNKPSGQRAIDPTQNRSQKLLTLADRLYFSNFYESAAGHYASYLELVPENYVARERFAHALERSGRHAEAAGEFYVLQWVKTTPIIQYRYAYNLHKSGRIEQAKIIYQNLLQQVPRQIPNFIKDFIVNWEKAWESVDINKYIAFYDKKISNNSNWRLRKESIFNRSGFIAVNLSEPMLISKNDNIYTVKFHQVYASQILKNEGNKTLRLACYDANCKIIRETWQAGKYVPFVRDDSLYSHIQQRLSEIEAQKEIKVQKKQGLDTFVPTVTQELVPPATMHKDILLSSGLKKVIRPGGDDKVFSNVNFEPLIIDSSNVVPESFIAEPIDYSLLNQWQAGANISSFNDNAGVNMWEYGAFLSHRVHQDIFLKGFVQRYNISDQGVNSDGGYFGVGLDSSRWDARDKWYANILLDQSGSADKVGWGLGYETKVLNNNVLFSLHRDNLVYTRRTQCSKELMRTKAEVSSSHKINSQRQIWVSLAGEEIDDGNKVFTPQFQYDFYDMSHNSWQTVFSLSGWYQFNQRQTACYYSPNKVDNNLFSVKTSLPMQKGLTFNARLAAGYSFWDSVPIYQTGAWLEGSFGKDASFKAGCNFSQSTSDLASGYQTTQCDINIGKRW